jgi:DNA-binding response OmpR family regulator
MCLHGPREKVDLSHRECSLLVALLRSPGQRMDYWQLLKLFGMGMDKQDKTNLEIRIVRLRRKMMAVGADKGCIRAIRLEGYQLCLAISIG